MPHCADCKLYRMAEFVGWPDTPEEMLGYDWHEGEEISYKGEGEFSTDFLSRSNLFSCESNSRKSRSWPLSQ